VKTRSFFIIVLFLILIIPNYAEVPIISQDTEIIIEYDTKKIYHRTSFNEYIYSYGKWGDIYGTERINTLYRTRELLDNHTDFDIVRGKYNNKLIVTRYDRKNNIHNYFIHDPDTNEYISLPELNINWNEKFKEIESNSLKYLFYYKDGAYILNLTDNAMNSHVYLFNSKTGVLNPLSVPAGETVDISRDKMNILVAGNHTYDVSIFNIEQDKVIGTIESYQKDYNTVCYFLDNNYFAVRIRSDMITYNVYGKEVLRFIINPPKNNFDSDLMGSFQYSDYYLMGIVEGRTIKQKYVCKAESKLDVLDSLGLLFKPTTATANDSRVRIREWPLLDAKHLDYLTKGDKLEILDRSGIKVKIGDMEDYWYKLRRVSDGMEGWSYGAFIDLDVE